LCVDFVVVDEAHELRVRRQAREQAIVLGGAPVRSFRVKLGAGEIAIRIDIHVTAAADRALAPRDTRRAASADTRTTGTAGRLLASARRLLDRPGRLAKASG
jgi:hypothetical protein